MDTNLFDEIYRAWRGYNDNDEFEEKELKPILEFYGVAEEDFQAELKRRIDK